MWIIKFCQVGEQYKRCLLVSGGQSSSHRILIRSCFRRVLSPSAIPEEVFPYSNCNFLLALLFSFLRHIIHPILDLSSQLQAIVCLSFVCCTSIFNSQDHAMCPVSTCPEFGVVLNTDDDFKAIIDSHNSLKKRGNPKLICTSTVEGCPQKDGRRFCMQKPVCTIYPLVEGTFSN
jgi:hypothetical protein